MEKDKKYNMQESGQLASIACEKLKLSAKVNSILNVSYLVFNHAEFMDDIDVTFDVLNSLPPTILIHHKQITATIEAKKDINRRGILLEFRDKRFLNKFCKAMREFIGKVEENEKCIPG